MYKIAISDLDGTLLGADHRISKKTKESIQCWINNDRRFVIATGRHYIEAQKIQETLGIPIYLISSNGARVHNANGDIIHQQNLDSHIAKEICNCKFSDTVQINVFTDHHWHANYTLPELDAMSLGAGFDCVATDLTKLDSNNIIKIFFYAEPDVLHPIYTLLKQRYGSQINLTFSLDKCLEVMQSETNKGSAARAVLEDKFLQPEQAIAFGDAMNDLEMLGLVGKPILMANSQERLRQALPDAELTLSSKNDGVAVVLDKILAR